MDESDKPKESEGKAPGRETFYGVPSIDDQILAAKILMIGADQNGVTPKRSTFDESPPPRRINSINK